MLVVLAAVAWLPGCLGPPSAAPGAATGADSEGLHAADARYDGVGSSERTSPRIRILAPEFVRDSRGVLRTAVAVEERWSEGVERHTISWLDGSGEVVRVDQACPMNTVAGPGCAAYSITWGRRTLPPMGIGWPALVERASPVAVGVESQREGSRLVLREGATEYVYGSSRLLPEEVRNSSGASLYRLARYEAGPSMGPLDEWPREAAPVPGPRRGELFPGDDRVYFGQRVSPRELYDELRSTDEVQVALNAGGCVRHVAYASSGGLRWEPPLVGGSKPVYNRTTGTFWIDHANGTAREWRVTYYEDPGRLDRFEAVRGGWRGVGGDCPSLLRSPWPRLDAREAVTTAFRFPIGRSDEFPPMLVYDLRDARDGLGNDTISVMFAPASSSGTATMMHSVQFNANLGTLRHIYFHPDDRAAFDR